ncbi:MAG: hypothetical protein ABSA05_03965 [Opitutaceae bacterium]|jgi:hypothetical protein
MSEIPVHIEVPLSVHPRTGSLEAWNAAYVRVEDYLRAHRIHNRLLQLKLIQKILDRAAVRHAANPSLDPTVLAAEETEAMMDAWFSEILEEQGQPHERIAVDGRVALLLCDGPQKWPYAFLGEGDLPPDFVKAMRTSSIRAGPDMAVSSMVARPIDLGRITEAAGETLDVFERWPILRTLLLWVIFAAGLGAIFRLTR